MATIDSISELGNQLVLNISDGRRLPAVPTTGGLFLMSEAFTVSDAPVEPPKPPEPEPEPAPAPGPAPGTTPPPAGGGGWQWPFQYSRFVIQNYKPAQYGMRVNPVSGKLRLHAGLDFGAGGIKGRDIPCAADGTVILAGANGGEGNAVHVAHAGGMITKYFHMVTGSMRVKKGDGVKQGQILGNVGTTGNSTGPHLHWETWPSSAGSQNPRDFMKDRGVPEN